MVTSFLVSPGRKLHVVCLKSVLYLDLLRAGPLGIGDMCQYLRTCIVCLKAQLFALQQQLLDLLHPGAQVFLKPAHYL